MMSKSISVILLSCGWSKIPKFVAIFRRVPLKFHNVSWAPLEPRENKVRYMDLNVKNPAMIDEPWTDRVNFWKALNYLH